MKCQNCNQDHIEENQPCLNCGFVSSPINQGWRWQDKAPGPQSVTAGDNWQFHLPLIGTGTAPRCQWLNLPGQQQDISSDNLMLEIKIPIDISGIYKPEYRIEGYAHLNGTLLLKVLPLSHSEEQNNGSAKPISQPQTQTQTQPQTPIASPIDNPATTDKPAVNPNHSSSSPQTSINTPVYIQVFRASTSIPLLKSRLESHKSLLVGKRSDSKGIFPDIDLKGHFSDSQNESICSREQARIYISNGRVFLHNLGKSPLQSEMNQTLITSGQKYNWQLNEIIQLPGGLKLMLTAL